MPKGLGGKKGSWETVIYYRLSLFVILLVDSWSAQSQAQHGRARPPVRSVFSERLPFANQLQLCPRYQVPEAVTEFLKGFSCLPACDPLTSAHTPLSLFFTLAQPESVDCAEQWSYHHRMTRTAGPCRITGTSGYKKEKKKKAEST